MEHLLALSVGDSGKVTPISGLPPGVDTIMSDPNLLPHVISLIFSLIFFIAAFLAFVFALFGGWRYMVSQGNKEDVEKARTMIVNSALGLFIALIALMLMNAIGYFFHLTIFKTTLF